MKTKRNDSSCWYARPSTAREAELRVERRDELERRGAQVFTPPSRIPLHTNKHLISVNKRREDGERGGGGDQRGEHGEKGGGAELY